MSTRRRAADDVKSRARDQRVHTDGARTQARLAAAGQIVTLPRWKTTRTSGAAAPTAGARVTHAFLERAAACYLRTSGTHAHRARGPLLPCHLFFLPPESSILLFLLLLPPRCRRAAHVAYAYIFKFVEEPSCAHDAPPAPKLSRAKVALGSGGGNGYLRCPPQAAKCQ